MHIVVIFSPDFVTGIAFGEARGSSIDELCWKVTSITGRQYPSFNYVKHYST